MVTPDKDGVRSYAAERFGHGLTSEIARLQMQVELSWMVECRRMAALGVRDGSSILETGCGPGFFPEHLAGWLPASRIVACDWDLSMLEAAQKRLARLC